MGLGHFYFALTQLQGTTQENERQDILMKMQKIQLGILFPSSSVNQEV